jgi:hypothetical protein
LNQTELPENEGMVDKIVKTDEEWRAQLTPEQYQVCRLKGTERPFTGELCALKEPGTYSCVCCGQALFEGSAKYESGTGWPRRRPTRATLWCARKRSARAVTPIWATSFPTARRPRASATA